MLLYTSVVISFTHSVVLASQLFDSQMVHFSEDHKHTAYSMHFTDPLQERISSSQTRNNNWRPLQDSNELVTTGFMEKLCLKLIECLTFYNTFLLIRLFHPVRKRLSSGKSFIHSYKSRWYSVFINLNRMFQIRNMVLKHI